MTVLHSVKSSLVSEREEVMGSAEGTLFSEKNAVAVQGKLKFFHQFKFLMFQPKINKSKKLHTAII